MCRLASRSTLNGIIRMVIVQECCEDQDIAPLPPHKQRHQYLRYEGLQYTDADIVDFEMRLANIYKREDADGALGCSGAEFGEAVLDLDTAGALQQIPDKGDLSAYWIGISSAGDFLGTPPSYTLIRDPMLSLCHRLIASSIAGRSQAPKKVGVAQGPERQPDARASYPKAAEDALIADEGAPAVLAPVHAPQPPPPAVGPAQTMAQRLARVEEVVHEIRGALG
ncbi:hypothetical protein Tco_1415755 [Tanacetum coccineum]